MIFIQRLHNTRGQGLAVEYAVLFFLITGAVVGINTFVKRAVQARVHDARQYAYTQVNAYYNIYYPGVAAPNGYEPYYQDTRNDRAESGETIQTANPWAGAGHEAQYQTNINTRTVTGTVANVLEAAKAK